MKKWTDLFSSNYGNRATNDDFVALDTFNYKGRRRVTVLIACDGVGSLPDSGRCSSALGRTVLKIVKNYLQRRCSAEVLGLNNAEEISKRLRSIKIKNIFHKSATTLALVIFDHQPKKSGYSVLVIWAGDSRVYLLDCAGQSYQLTQDHHDNEGSLTAYFAGDGKIYGKLEVAHFLLPDPPHAIYVTTDGIHEHCQPDELSQFIQYCIDEHLRSNEQLSRNLLEFLSNNISDNFSLALMYRWANSSQITEPVANFGEVNDADKINIGQPNL